MLEAIDRHLALAPELSSKPNLTSQLLSIVGDRQTYRQTDGRTHDDFKMPTAYYVDRVIIYASQTQVHILDLACMYSTAQNVRMNGTITESFRCHVTKSWAVYFHCFDTMTCKHQGRRFSPKLGRAPCPHPLSLHPFCFPLFSHLPSNHLPQNPATESQQRCKWAGAERWPPIN